jgi:hypothetical protein
MSYDAMLDAMKSNPELAREIHDAPTVSHREAILDKHGIDKPSFSSPLPSKEQVKSMSEVAGGSTYFNMTACGAA